MNRRAEIDFQKTLVLAAAAAHSDGLDKHLTTLREMMLPELAEERNEAIQKALKTLEAEAKKGPIKIQSTELKQPGRRELGVEHAGRLRRT